MSSCGAEVHFLPTAQLQSSLFGILDLDLLVWAMPGGGVIELELTARHSRSASATVSRWSRPQTAIRAQAHQLITGNVCRCQDKPGTAILTIPQRDRASWECLTHLAQLPCRFADRTFKAGDTLMS